MSLQFQPQQNHQSVSFQQNLQTIKYDIKALGQNIQQIAKNVQFILQYLIKQNTKPPVEEHFQLRKSLFSKNKDKKDLNIIEKVFIKRVGGEENVKQKVLILDQNKKISQPLNQNELHQGFLNLRNKNTVSEVLMDHLNKKMEVMGLKFQKSQKLYSFPEQSLTNFHSKIDQKNNILLLMKLQNDQFIGAFTEIGFYSKPNFIPKENPRAFLFNLNKDIYLFAEKIIKTHSYDKNYLIFGTWELKIKTGQPFLEADIGNAGACFTRNSYINSKATQINKHQEGSFFDSPESKKIEIQQYFVYQLS